MSELVLHFAKNKSTLLPPLRAEPSSIAMAMAPDKIRSNKKTVDSWVSMPLHMMMFYFENNHNFNISSNPAHQHGSKILLSIHMSDWIPKLKKFGAKD